MAPGLSDVSRAPIAPLSGRFIDVNGVRLDKEDPESLIHSLDGDASHKMIESGQIASGMIPKVEACLQSLDRGVGKVHIIDGRLRHSLLLEIYTNKGVGTQIVR